MPDPSKMFRFGDFELDVPAYELRRQGVHVKLERQPMDLLILLVERRQQLVSRSDIVDRLWGKDAFIDVETGINTAIRKIRHVLDDARETPAFVETVSGKGYRFIAPVDVIPANGIRTRRRQARIVTRGISAGDPRVSVEPARCECSPRRRDPIGGI